MIVKFDPFLVCVCF